MKTPKEKITEAERLTKKEYSYFEVNEKEELFANELLRLERKDVRALIEKSFSDSIDDMSLLIGLWKRGQLELKDIEGMLMELKDREKEILGELK